MGEGKEEFQYDFQLLNVKFLSLEKFSLFNMYNSIYIYMDTHIMFISII